jgi:hypothetical protein
LVAGAVQEITVRAFSPPVARTAPGAAGTAVGRTGDESTDVEPVPDAFVAVTVNVYEMPFVNPVTVQDVVAVEHWNEPGEDVTVYEEIDAPPVDAGAVQDTTD